ncbi:hypothetical protein SRHO_G00125350 [Serrasalmus rhombeus]
MLSKKITLLWILMASLYRIGPVQAVNLQQKPSFISANLGEAVTLCCTFDKSTSNERMVWYKQKVGQTLQWVGMILTNVDPILSDEFKQPGIQLEVNKSSISLTIQHTTKDDEGTEASMKLSGGEPYQSGLCCGADLRCQKAENETWTFWTQCLL